MIVNRKANVVLLHELFDAWEGLRSRVAGHNDGDAGALAIFELAANVVVLVLRKVNGSRSVQLDARSSVVRKRLRLRLRFHRKMILDVLRIQRRNVELLHETDHLVAGEVAKRIASHAQMNRQRLSSRLRWLRQQRDGTRRNARCRKECTRLNEVAAGK